MEKTAERKANAGKFERLMQIDRTAYILAVMLSALKPGTRVYSRGSEGYGLYNILDQQVTKILFENADNPLIKKNMRFHSTYRDSEEIKTIFYYHRRLIGIDSWGMDFDFEVTQKTHEVAKEARQYFSKKEIEFLQGLGRKIKTGRANRYPA